MSHQMLLLSTGFKIQNCLILEFNQASYLTVNSTNVNQALEVQADHRTKLKVRAQT